MTPSPTKKAKKSVERGGWKKPAAQRNECPSSGPVLRSNCLFFKLPPEIRCMIYSDLIRSGDLEVLRLCQKIHREAIGIIYRDGIQRVNTYSSAYRMALYGRQMTLEMDRISDKAQNVEIYIHLENHFGSGYEVDFLEALHPELKNTSIRRKNCWIYLRYNDYRVKSDTESLIIVLRLVQHFDNVFLNIHLPINLILDHCKTLRLNHLADFVEPRFESLGNEMEPFFGPSTWHNSHDPMKQYWVFHPRQARPEGY